jgi:hypothetical protein
MDRATWILVGVVPLLPTFSGCRKESQAEETKLCFATPGNDGSITDPSDDASAMLLRTEGEPARGLLQKYINYGESLDISPAQKNPAKLDPPGIAVFRYDPASNTLAQADDSLWKQLPGGIVDCDRAGLGTAEFARAFEVQRSTDTLLFRGTIVTTAGKTYLYKALSPGKTLVSILSASGHRRVGMWPFGGGGASGQHYHQLFKWPEMTPVGDPVPISAMSGSQVIRACWSPDEQYVVYTDLNYSFVCIVPVKPTKKGASGP